MLKMMNNPNTQLKDLIHVERGIIPSDLCDYIVSEIEKREWHPHIWYNDFQGTLSSAATMEPDVQTITAEHQNLLTPFMMSAASTYNARYHFESEKTIQIMKKLCGIRFNRYSPGQIMRAHMDHIHSLFDGNEKGIPVLSFILNLNDDYEGADLVFWEDHIVPLGKGDIVMFPSLFLFPHMVTEAIKGLRYSAVSWAW
jgi:predicted 2-oxoglutarate/Fe(II)-dependent dioxygenase YbiX